MVFSSLIFLYIFLPISILLYYIVDRKIKNYVLLIISVVFYAFGEVDHLYLVFFISLLNYISGLIIDYYENSMVKKITLILNLGINLSILGYYKYITFIFSEISKIGIGFEFKVSQVLPLGISFFTFQALSYTIDVYRKQVRSEKNYFNVLLYIFLFPQLIAGPIVRYITIAKQIRYRTHSIGLIESGIERFIIGLGKKVIIANTLGKVYSKILSYNVDLLSWEVAFVGIVCYSLQIYFDFSGYSDMAIGLGRIFGFHFEENFNYPYISLSIKEFWRRWHISLSTWFRDYLYIPLGGNKLSKVRTYINLMLVFFLCGFWHGAGWNFILWGVFHGFFLIMERLIDPEKYQKNYQKVIRLVYTANVVMVGWVFFSQDSLSYSFSYLKTIYFFKDRQIIDISFLLSKKVILTLLIAFLSMSPIVYNQIRRYLIIRYSYLIAILFISSIYLLTNTYNPFIYFRF